MNVLARQDRDVHRDQGMMATHDATASELATWFSELQMAYQAEPSASYVERKHRLLALKKTTFSLSRRTGRSYESRFWRSKPYRVHHGGCACANS